MVFRFELVFCTLDPGFFSAITFLVANLPFLEIFLMDDFLPDSVFDIFGFFDLVTRGDNPFLLFLMTATASANFVLVVSGDKPRDAASNIQACGVSKLM